MQGRLPVRTESGLRATMEHGASNDTLSVYDIWSAHSFWDAQGRVIREDFTGYGKAGGPERLTNTYEFDAQGRLVTSSQFTEKVGVGQGFIKTLKYEYPVGRPDNEYTEISTGIDGRVETITFEDRQKIWNR